MSRAKYCKFFRECKSKAVYRIPHSNLALCKDHFLANVEKRVQKLVKKSHIIRREGKNKILIALSGGKDSQVLLSIMKKSYPENIELHGLYIELGISDENYSKDSGIIAQSLCNKLNVPFHEINVKQQNGFNIDDIYNLKQIVEENKQKSKNDQIRGECSYCGLLKRYHINKFAVENDFSVVLTGHNLTDEATSLVNNFFNVDIGFLKKPGYFLESKTKNLVSRLKPLFYISEEEIVMYAYLSKIEHLPTECPYSAQAPNIKIKKTLLEIEQYRKGNMISLLRRYYKVMQPEIKNANSTEKHLDRICAVCGSPTFSKICNFCKTTEFMLETLKKHKIQLDV